MRHSLPPMVQLVVLALALQDTDEHEALGCRAPLAQHVPPMLQPVTCDQVVFDVEGLHSKHPFAVLLPAWKHWPPIRHSLPATVQLVLLFDASQIADVQLASGLVSLFW